MSASVGVEARCGSIGFAVGSLEASRTEPRLSGVSRQGETQTPCASGSPIPSSTIWIGGDVELDVGRLGAAADAGEAARLGEVGGERAGLGGFELLQRRRLQRRAAGSRGSGVVQTL